MDQVDHASREHALLSASAAERWMHCTPSAVLSLAIPDQQTEYSKEGSRAHEIAQMVLDAYFTGITAPTFEGDDLRILKETQPYIDGVIETFNQLRKDHPDAVCFREVKVDYGEWVPCGWGTSDAVLIAGDTLIVRDLKFGKGLEVDAQNNPQLRCYMLGSYAMFSEIYIIKKVIGEIHQPRLDHFSSEELTIEELLNWAETELKPKAEIASLGEGELVPGDWCRFCKLRATCRARADQYLDVLAAKAEELLPSSLTDQEVSDLLLKAKGMDQWLKSLRDYASTKIKTGEGFPGWKLVAGRSNRTYKDTLKAASALKKAGVDESLIYTKELLGVTSMEKLLGKEKFKTLLTDPGLVYKPEGTPTLVEESDQRKSLYGTDDFEGIDLARYEDSGEKGESHGKRQN